MPADPILTLSWLVLAHLTADFIVQTSAVVMAKNAPGPRGWRGLGAHGLGVAACLIPVALAFGLPGLWVLIAITARHMLRRRPAGPPRADGRGLGDLAVRPGADD